MQETNHIGHCDRVVLELRPSCECCDRDLLDDPASTVRVFAPEGCART
jgi:hypothetical protein